MSEDKAVVPNFLKLQSIPVDYIQQVETDLLEPVVHQEATATTTGFCRFELQRKGFLHSHSKLFVSLIPNEDNARAFLPQGVGIASVIDRAVLKVGNQVLNEISDWANLHAIKSQFIDNEYQKEREQYTTGRCINHRYMFKDADGNQSKVLSAKYGLDNGREYSGTATGVGQLQQLPFANMDGTTAGKRSESPVYCIDLVDLFPFLSRQELPLYMIDAPVSIELVWSKTNRDRVCATGAGDSAVNKPYLIDKNELKFCADYIYYGATDEMARFASANPSLEFSFEDYRLSKSTVTEAALQAGIVANLGMANRMVSRVLTVMTESADSDASILNRYLGEAPEKEASGEVAALEYNIRYNDRFEYATNLNNTARIFNQLVASEGIPFVTRQEYSGEQQGITSATFELRQQNSAADTGIRGCFFTLATRLTGKRVGQRGIELHLKVANVRALGNLHIRSYCEYLRRAVLSNGMFEVYNV